MDGERQSHGRFDPERAREAGRRSAESRRRKAAANALLAAPPLVPRLTDLDACLLAYDAIAQRLAAGLMAGSQGMAASRCVNGYVEALGLKLDTERVKRLEQHITELEADLAAARGGSLG